MLSHWIYTKLKLNGKISETEIQQEFEGFSPVAFEGMNALEKEGIVFSDVLYDEKNDKTEKIYFAKKVVV